jgi:hypothetical protein
MKTRWSLSRLPVKRTIPAIENEVRHGDLGESLGRNRDGLNKLLKREKITYHS